ncbi:Cytochrome c biogenesis ATP-binding export protein ccmA (Heme exporter protein A) [Bartonella clarridgeiae 73]|uniref:Cytochrome c biogenesis ATP-binding export protein ccmA (Heme exporter protein A) n=1 Tax=Bartonella clarridgeiae (strain CCUG 45776 / CIP 104772 / 73) TaxID=696125 RepID=E6YG21_BARC7|nr:heme ABC exporter ATP-binding protein CcmA [Bartonella clarridgeiae]WCR55584.1 MAG: ABC transporter involved in cytochrome c biogenesis ATPase component CcmA [Bartonella clarridgeiae]CBI75809.1 Cytochrome c biogenesis ATP-binding export protein ccmA (Heme exporter protein A) [Bartonella clarridgeiae 73]
MVLSGKNLTVHRNEKTLFKGLSFSLSTQQLMTITGPNGIGKSTLLRIIVGLFKATEGDLKLEDKGKIYPLAIACHYLNTQNAMKSSLSVIDNLKFWAEFYGQHFYYPHDALADIGLSDLAHLPFNILSTGQKRRVAIARLLLSYRPIWVLDEPISGLDHYAQTIFAKLFQRHLNQGGMIIAATHIPLGLKEHHVIALEHFYPLRKK